MKLKTLAATLATLSIMCAAPTVVAQVKIGVVSSSTGPTALVGISQKNTVPLLPKKIGGLSIDYIAFDDGSDPTQTDVDFKKLLTQDKVDAIIGPTGSPNPMGGIQLAAESGKPIMTPVGSASVIQHLTPEKERGYNTTQQNTTNTK